MPLFLEILTTFDIAESQVILDSPLDLLIGLT